MKKVLYMAAVLLAYCGLWIGTLNGIGAGTILETIWGGLLLFMTGFVLYCFPVVIARYLVKRAPFENAAKICAGCACMYVCSVIKLSGVDLASIVGIAGLGLGSWVSYQMLSK